MTLLEADPITCENCRSTISRRRQTKLFRTFGCTPEEPPPQICSCAHRLCVTIQSSRLQDQWVLLDGTVSERIPSEISVRFHSYRTPLGSAWWKPVSTAESQRSESTKTRYDTDWLSLQTGGSIQNALNHEPVEVQRCWQTWQGFG